MEFRAICNKILRQSVPAKKYGLSVGGADAELDAAVEVTAVRSELSVPIIHSNRYLLVPADALWL